MTRIELQCRSLGNPASPSLTLLEAMISDRVSMQRLADALARAFHVVVVEHPTLVTRELQEAFSWETLRRSLEHTLQERGIAETVLVGHSISIYEALDLALHSSIHVRGLYLMGAVAGLDPSNRAAYGQLARWLRSDPPAVRAMYLDQLFEPDFAAAHPDLMDRIRAVLEAIHVESLATQLDAMVELPDLRPSLGTLIIPVLIRAGTADATTPIELAREIAGAVQGAELEEVPNKRHFLLLDDEAETHASLLTFLERHGFADTSRAASPAG